jgi:hypothetical protein
MITPRKYKVYLSDGSTSIQIGYDVFDVLMSAAVEWTAENPDLEVPKVVRVEAYCPESTTSVLNRIFNFAKERKDE